MHRWGAAAFAVLLAIEIPAPLRAAAADVRAVLTLRVNTVVKDDATVILRGDDVLVKRADLEQAGIERLDFQGAKPDDLISLASLAPRLTFKVDDKALALDITVPPDHLATTTFDYHTAPALQISKPARSAFANYSVGLSSQAGANFSGEAGTHLGAGLLKTTATFAARGGYDSHLTQWVVDSPEKDERSSVGDVEMDTGDLGGAADLEGAEVQRYFGLNPGTIAHVLPGIRGSVDTPATANVYVNGTLVRQETLPPGDFNFQNLPVTLGPNTTQIVVTDAFGRQQTYGNYFYGSDQLLASGVSDFAYGAGVPRSQFGLAPAVNGVVAAARYSRGINADLTGGGRLEANASLLSGGGSAVFRLRDGVVGVDAAASRSGDAGGTAAALTFQTSTNRVNVGASLVLQSPHYATISQAASGDRALSNASFELSFPGRRSDVALIYTGQRDRDSGMQRGWQLTRMETLSSSASLEVGVNLFSTPAGKQMGFTAALNLIPRGDTSAFVTTSDYGGQHQVSASIARSTAAGTPSFGYDAGVTASQGTPAAGFATAEYRGQYGNYFGTLTLGGSNPAALSMQMAGGFVAIGGKLFATQPLTDSYALIDADGLAGVRVSVNGFDEGRTNRAGYAILPQMGSYFDNTIALDPNDVPMSYAIDDAAAHVTPEYRAGEVVKFRMKRVLPVTGDLSVVMAGRMVVPAYGILEVGADGTTRSSDIGENGEFYFDSLPAGDYGARIRFKGGECTFTLHVPKTDKTFLKLGTLLCLKGVPS